MALILLDFSDPDNDPWTATAAVVVVVVVVAVVATVEAAATVVSAEWNGPVGGDRRVVRVG